LGTGTRELEEELGVKDVQLIEVGKGRSNERNSHDGGHRIHVFQIYRCFANPIKLQDDEVKGMAERRRELIEYDLNQLQKETQEKERENEQKRREKEEEREGQREGRDGDAPTPEKQLLKIKWKACTANPRLHRRTLTADA
jgi:hypothetical protein